MNLTLKNLPDPETMKVNILGVYDGATEEHIREGHSWYAETLELARDIAAGTPHTVEQIVGIMAIISGQQKWVLNKVYPRYIVNNYALSMSMDEWRTPEGKGFYIPMEIRCKCVRILEGEDPRQFLGPKTGAFFANILGDKEVVTVDRWAMRVAVANSKVQSATEAAIRKISDAYVAAAITRETTPGACQATTWVAYRDGKREKEDG